MRGSDTELEDPTMAMRRLDAPSAEAWLAGHGGRGVAVIYKHSPICAQSLFAASDVRYFAQDFPEIPVYQINVVTQRTLARDLARALGVAHESPQVLWLRDGEVVWAGSHGQVAYDALRRLAADPAGGA